MAKTPNLGHSAGQFLLEMVAANQPHLIITMAIGGVAHINIVPNRWSDEFQKHVNQFLSEKGLL